MMKTTHDVWITGMGVCSPVGQRVADFWSALCQGQSGIRPLTQLTDTRYVFRQAGEITDRPAALPGEPPTAGAGYRFVSTAMAEALKQSLPQPCEHDAGAPIGLILGSNFGDNVLTEGWLASRRGKTLPVAGAFETGFQSVADHLAVQFDLQGPRMVLSLSCASGAAAVAMGVSWIRSGRVSRVLVGGFDALSDFWWSGLSALRAMTADALRPFDVKRSGTIFGEGAAVLMLTSPGNGAEGIQPLARVAGVGLSNNAFHMTAPDKEAAGLGRAMSAALADAGLGAETIDHVNCHGTGTRFNDVTEAQAIKNLFGDRARMIPVTAIKSMTSHTMGAAGAMEAVASVMTLRTGIVPPTVNLREQDPECDLNVVTRVDARYGIDTVLSNSAGIGGCNAALVLTR